MPPLIRLWQEGKVTSVSNYNRRKRILVITHDYWPEASARAIRWSTITEYWAQKGYTVHVVALWKPGLAKFEILNGVHLYRVGWDASIIHNFLSNLRFKQFQEGENGSSPKTNIGKLSSLAKFFYDISFKQIRWPDYAFSWYFPALNKASQLMEVENYGTVISVSFPFTGHLVGLSLKKKFSDFFWLVDVGDPFSWLEELQTNNFRLFKKINIFAEKMVFEAADAITVTAKATWERYLELFSFASSKTTVIPHVIPHRRNSKPSPLFWDDSSKIRLVFVGTLYRKVRSPDFLLRLFLELQKTELKDNIELHFFGNINDCWDCFEGHELLLNETIFIHGLVKPNQAQQVLTEASILVNIGNETPYQLPSKVVDYISTGKPVLNIMKTPQDSSAEFFKHYPAVFCLLESEQVIGSPQLKQLFRFIENPPEISHDTLQQLCHPFQVESIAMAYENHFLG